MNMGSVRSAGVNSQRASQAPGELGTLLLCRPEGSQGRPGVSLWLLFRCYGEPLRVGTEVGKSVGGLLQQSGEIESVYQTHVQNLRG